MTEVHPLDANLISSEKANGRHVLLLDLDQESFAVSSTSPGHNHIYINADLTFDALQEIVTVLAKHGVLQQGIKMQVEAGKCLTLRPPGTQKGVYEDEVDVKEYKKLQDLKNKPVADNTIDIGFCELLQENVADFKTHLNQKSISFHKVEDGIKKGIFRVLVTAETMEAFIKTALLKLDLDYIKAVIVTHSEPSPFGAGEYIKGQMRYEGNFFAEFHFNVQYNQYMIEFRKETFDGPAPGGVPHNWPTWENLVKVMSHF